MLDQRGTGRSTPVGTLPGMSPRQQAEYLAHFRADSIVRDAEWIRRELGVERWSVLGQSFGGFCVTTYLSLAPRRPARGDHHGRPSPTRPHRRRVYPHTYRRVQERNRKYLERYPSDRERLVDLERRIDDDVLRLPSGDRLTWRRFRQAGSDARHERRRRAPALPARASLRFAGVPARRRAQHLGFPATRSTR